MPTRFWLWDLPLIAATAFVFAGVVADLIDWAVGRPDSRRK